MTDQGSVVPKQVAPIVTNKPEQAGSPVAVGVANKPVVPEKQAPTAPVNAVKPAPSIAQAAVIKQNQQPAHKTASTATTNKPIVPNKPAPAVQEKNASPAVTVKNVFEEDSWMYHTLHEPKLFKKGEEVPEDWSHMNTFGWFRDQKNNFHWRKK